MNLARRLAGLVAVLAIAVALNFLVMRENLFISVVLVPLAVGLAAALLWFVLTLITLAGAAERTHRLQSLNIVLASCVFLAICVVLYAFARHSGRSWDLTREGRRQLSEQTIKVLQSLREDVTVHCLFPRSGEEAVDTARKKTLRFLEQCQRHTMRLHVETADPYEEGEDGLRARGVEVAGPHGTVALRCGTRPAKIILLRPPNPRLEERDFTNALINVSRDTNPKVYFLAGHGEKSLHAGDPEKGIFTLKDLLDREGYIAEQLVLTRPDAFIPSDCDLLVINGLETNDPSAAELGMLTEYTDNGGNLLVFIDPRVLLYGSEGFRPWIEQRFGIRIGGDYVISGITDRLGEVRLVSNHDAMSYLEQADLPQDTPFDGCYNPNHPITQGFTQTMLLWTVRSVALADPLPDGVAGAEILFTLPFAWAETDVSFLDPQATERRQPRPDAGERSGSVPVAAAVTRNTDIPIGDSGQTRASRVVVVGDADFAGDQLLTVAGNLNFVMNAFAWLTTHEELIAIRPTGKQDAPLLLTDAQERAIVWIPTLGIVQLLIVLAVLAYLLRRKYR